MPDGGAEPKCKSCDWYDEWFGVCCNADSAYCADWPPLDFSWDCEAWEVKKKSPS